MDLMLPNLSKGKEKIINSENYTKIPSYKKLRPCMQEVNFLSTESSVLVNKKLATEKMIN